MDGPRFWITPSTDLLFPGFRLTKNKKPQTHHHFLQVVVFETYAAVDKTRIWTETHLIPKEFFAAWLAGFKKWSLSLKLCFENKIYLKLFKRCESNRFKSKEFVLIAQTIEGTKMLKIFIPKTKQKKKSTFLSDFFPLFLWNRVNGRPLVSF